MEKKRHKWDKKMYNGKMSSFEVSATCKNCGCERERLGMGFAYNTKDGKRFYEAPNCETLTAN